MLKNFKIGTMAKALNGFFATLEDQAGVAANVARGVLSADIAPRSSQDTLATALQQMTATLRDNAADTALRDWTRNGQSKVYDASRGTLDEDELEARLIHALAEHLDAQRGAFYVFRENPSRLQFISGYATNGETIECQDFGIGQGLIGQAAKDRRPVCIDQVPDDYCTIRSSLGQAAPRSLVLFPLVLENRLLGVVELAFTAPVDERRVSFLASVEESICIALQTAQHQVELRDLLAEDNPVNQKFAIRVLEKNGHSVVVANNGREAVEAWQHGTFDLVLMDVQMPEVDGFEATATIRKLEQEENATTPTPIIAMTANAMKGDKELCLDTGMDGYVSKPVKRQTLFAEIERVLGTD